MHYHNLETALRELSGAPQPGGPLYHTAGLIQAILEDRSLSPEEQADALAEMIRSRNPGARHGSTSD